MTTPASVHAIVLGLTLIVANTNNKELPFNDSMLSGPGVAGHESQRGKFQ
jgi:hypothetical protein